MVEPADDGPPSGNPEGVQPQSPGLRRPRRYPGYGWDVRHNPDGGCAGESNGCLDPQGVWRGNANQLGAVPVRPNRGTYRNIPGFYDGTTLPGWFCCQPFTHGSTSAVQPWALCQNPGWDSRPGQGVVVGGLLIDTAP